MVGPHQVRLVLGPQLLGELRVLPQHIIEREAQGGPDCIRLVTAFDTDAGAVEAFIASARRNG